MNRLVRLWASRRLVTKINLVIGAALLLVFAYVGATAYAGATSQIRYDSNDFPGAKKAASAFLRLSPIQRHIGYFNRGTAEAAIGDYDAAQTDLESALDITPTRDECAVRINLSYVYEKQADEIADQDSDQSEELYEKSLKTLEDAPTECQPKKSDDKQKSEQAKERVQDKKEGQKAKDGDSGDTGTKKDDTSKDDSDQDSDSEQGEDDQSSKDDDKSEDSSGTSDEEKKREELKKRGEDSERQQQQPGPGGEGGRTTPDKPW